VLSYFPLCPLNGGTSTIDFSFISHGDAAAAGRLKKEELSLSLLKLARLQILICELKSLLHHPRLESRGNSIFAVLSYFFSA